VFGWFRKEGVVPLFSIPLIVQNIYYKTHYVMGRVGRILSIHGITSVNNLKQHNQLIL